MAQPSRRVVFMLVFVAAAAVLGWTYYQSLVPAIHPDHDHGLENIAGGGFLRVDRVEGGRRNLVGKPKGVLILHWFDLKSPTTASELPLLVEYAESVKNDPGIEILLIATGATREELGAWARGHGVPTRNLHADPEGKTTSLIGVRRLPDTLIYGPDGSLAQQTRGPVNWADPRLRAAVDQIRHGAGGDHQH
uniref:TlpA family protein disulfide reductase n=1 Tax=Eiseniibacteriota bacterium TaxID=2212470 RepID=A0A832MN94_UNCEI